MRASACSTCTSRGLDGVATLGRGSELTVRGGGQLEELVVGRGSEPAPEVGDRLEPLLDALERARLGVERRDEAMEVAAGLAQPHGEVAQLLGSRAELGRDALERGKRPLRECCERRRALSLVGRDRRGGRARRLGELLDVSKSFAAREKLLLVSGSHALGRVDESLQLGEPRSDRIGVTRELVVPSPCREELPPRVARLAPPLVLLGSAERIEDVELERGPREPTLLELPRHRDEALRGRSDVLARDRATPRVRARAPVAEDPPRDDEPGLALGPQLGERGELVLVEEPFRHVELGLDVRLGPVAADRRRVGARPEQQPDRLREDRLPRPRLARDRIQPGRERELSLADEDEVLDPKPTKHDP